MTEPPGAIVSDGKINFGLFSSAPPKLDIRGVKGPFGGIALPAVITNMRIKSRLAFVFALEDCIGLVEFFDDKVFGLAELVIWNTATGKKYSYHTFMPMRRRFIPHKTDKAICASHKKSRRVRISWNRKNDRVTLTFSVKGCGAKPDVAGGMTSRFSSPFFTETVAVNPAPTSRRASASWIVTMRASGAISFIPRKKGGASIPRAANGSAVMSMNRAYYGWRSKSVFACALGTVDGDQVAFRCAQSSADPASLERGSENILALNGKVTPLPPVTVTHIYGIDKTWNIQDTDSMVDLKFTPVSISSRSFDILVMKSASDAIYGTFEGVLLTSDGVRVELRGLPGIVKRNAMRI